MTDEQIQKIAEFLVGHYKSQGHEVTLEQAKEIAKTQLDEEKQKQILAHLDVQKNTKSVPVKAAESTPQPAGDVSADAGAKKDDEDYLKIPLTPEEEAVIKNGKYEGVIKLPDHPNTEFDESHFLFLLKESVSLNWKEKTGIIDNMPKLSQHQVDELVRIFEDEQTKLKKLDKKYPGELPKMKSKFIKEWEQAEEWIVKKPEREAAAKQLEVDKKKSADEEEKAKKEMEDKLKAA